MPESDNEETQADTPVENEPTVPENTELPDAAQESENSEESSSEEAAAEESINWEEKYNESEKEKDLARRKIVHLRKENRRNAPPANSVESDISKEQLEQLQALPVEQQAAIWGEYHEEKKRSNQVVSDGYELDSIASEKYSDWGQTVNAALENKSEAERALLLRQVTGAYTSKKASVDVIYKNLKKMAMESNPFLQGSAVESTKTIIKKVGNPPQQKMRTDSTVETDPSKLSPEENWRRYNGFN